MNVRCFDQNGTEFARLEMDQFPRKDDTIEIGFPDQPLRHFTVWRVVWKMEELPKETKYVEGVAVECRPNKPWRWDIHLYGYLYDPTSEVPKAP